MGSTKISPQTKSTKSLADSRGFTLVEVIVVIALIAMITFFALPSISGAFKASLNSTARQLASVTKEAYNSAVLTGRVYRLAFDLKNDQFWVEAGPNAVLLDTVASKEKQERRKRFRRDEETPAATGFQMDKIITRKKQSLPRGVTFEDVLLEREAEAVTEGMAYTHIFPHGITEQTILHLQDNAKHKMTLVVTALSGKTRLFERYVDRKEALGEE